MSLVILLISIDGNKSGGQVLRTGSALSTITGKAFKISEIRGLRPNPGLKIQHMEAIRALGKLCNAEIIGLKLGSKELEFVPRAIVENDLKVKISTAGSIGLFLQALTIATSQMDRIEIEIEGGGTWNKWAPPVLYLDRVLFPLIGEESIIKIKRNGFYPKGGANVRLVTKPLKHKKINIIKKGEIVKISGYSIASSNLKKAEVVSRQTKKAKKMIKDFFGIDLDIEEYYDKTLSAGSGVLVYIKTENSIIGADSLGEKGKSSEKVAEEAVKKLRFEYENGAVDSHAANMLLPYMALAGSGKIKTSRITEHIIANASLIEKFLPVKFNIDENERVISCKD